VAQVAAAALVEEVAASQQPSRHGLLNVQARRAYLYILKQDKQRRKLDVRMRHVVKHIHSTRIFIQQ